MTDRCKNINLPQTSFAGSKYHRAFFFNFRSSWADQMDEFDLKTSSSKADKTEVNGDKSKAKRKREAKQRRRKNKQEVRALSLRAELYWANETAKAKFCNCSLLSSINDIEFPKQPSKNPTILVALKGSISIKCNPQNKNAFQ